MKTLYVVATPLGNLEDITLRALRVLKEADLILCEDTRHASKLLNHYGIKTAKLSYHEHNEKERTEKVLSILNEGKKVALISDAGTPGISDPGQVLVEAVLNAGGKVEPVPGASAITAALSASGFPSGSFSFLGFLPPKSKARQDKLGVLSQIPVTLVFYEAPHRLIKTLTDMESIFGNREAVVGREITKIHEEFIRAPLKKLVQIFSNKQAVKGEVVIVVAGNPRPSSSIPNPVEAAQKLIQEKGFSKREAAKQVARQTGFSSRELYQKLL